MPVIQREFGKKPPLKESLDRGREFTDMAMAIDIDDVLDFSPTIDYIPRRMAKLTGIRLQLEGDGSSKNIVGAAYAAINNLSLPTFQAVSITDAASILTTDQTHETIRQLSKNVDSGKFERLTADYRKSGKHFVIDENGLRTKDDFVITAELAAETGCPYTAGKNRQYFDDFTDHIVETFARAHQSGMPQGWLERVNRSYLRR